MKECEYCDKKHDGSFATGRFCNKKCASGYSTKAKRKEINEKVSKTMSENIIKKCKYCNCTILRDRSVCDICIQYTGNLKLFKKINVFETNKRLDKINKEALDFFVDLYFNKKWSLIDIENRLFIYRRTLQMFFKKNKLDLRSLSESALLSFLDTQKHKLTGINSSNYRYKHGWHKTWNNKQIYYRSSYELRYAKYLDNKKILYEVESKRILYFDSNKNIFRIAIPDFYLPQTNTIVEIKSEYTYDKDNMDDRFSEYEKQGYKVKLFLDVDIKNLQA